MQLRTDRLILRPWREEDRAPFAQLNADERVMRHYPSVLTRAESNAIADRIEGHFAKYGYGFWAVEVPGMAEFIGFIGLQNISFETSFAPATEIGWRLAAAYWGNGYATEGARTTVDFAFDELGLDQLVSFTVPGNTASRRVMDKLGMRHEASLDFDHPDLPRHSPLRRHVFYQLSRSDWRASPP